MESEEASDQENELESEIYEAERDIYRIQRSFNTNISFRESNEDLVGALTSNRIQLEPLREKYARAVHSDGGIKSPASRERRVLAKELLRIYRATELIKNEMRRRGVDYEVVPSDEEHPNAAYKRYLRGWEAQWEAERRAAEAQRRSQSSCYVITAIYGHFSMELKQARRVCRRRFALNPLMVPSWIIYKLVGPVIAYLIHKYPIVSPHVDRLLARPIVRASSGDFMTAASALAYLSLFGWAVVGTTAFILAW